LKAKTGGFLLAIDIGNSSISCGLFKSGALKHHFSICSNEFPKIGPIINKCGGRNIIDKVIIVSVNPKLTGKLRVKLQKIVPKRSILVLGRDVKVKIKHQYASINQLGLDRLVNIYGAIRWYRRPILIIDFGTATTFDLVTKRGTFKGGLIIPGIETAWEALIRRAALLPKLEINRKQKMPLVGTSTVSCMQAGLLQGFGAMVDGLIERYTKRKGERFTILAAGGLARLIRPYVLHPMKLDPFHTIKSLAFIAADREKRSLHG